MVMRAMQVMRGGVVAHLDLPDLGSAPDVQGARSADDLTFGGAAQMVGVDLQAHDTGASGVAQATAEPMFRPIPR